MSKLTRQETVSNLSSKFLELQETVQKLEAERKALAENASKMTPEGIAASLAILNKLAFQADEHASYLGSIFAGYIARVGAKNPATIVTLYGILKNEIPEMVEIVNESKAKQKAAAEAKKSAEIQEKANELLAKLAEMERKAVRNPK